MKNSEEYNFKILVQGELEKIRKMANLTQDDFAHENGIQPTTYKNWVKKSEKGPIIPLFYLIKIAKKYKVNLNDLFGLDSNTSAKGFSTLSNNPQEKEAFKFLKNRARFIPLITLGMMGNYYERLIYLLYSDKDVKEFIYNKKRKGYSGKVEMRKPLLVNLLSVLDSPHQRDLVFGVLLKYIAQLLIVDKGASPSEKFFFDRILKFNKMKKGFFNIKETDQEEAKNLIDQELRGLPPRLFFHNNEKAELKECFSQPIIQKVLIWVLIIASACDGEISSIEKEYIEKVSTHVGMAKEELNEIFTQVNSVLYEDAKAA
jgi:transcriptional regulator with XRE-family HTH domain